MVVTGRAESPVYINIGDDKITIEDARDLWGLIVWRTEEEIWKRTPVRHGSEWQKLGEGYTTQRPSIVAIGPAGENKTRVASLIHGAGNGAGQGGFGGVFGSKNLKAIAVLGTAALKWTIRSAFEGRRSGGKRTGLRAQPSLFFPEP